MVVEFGALPPFGTSLWPSEASRRAAAFCLGLFKIAPIRNLGECRGWDPTTAMAA